MSDVDLNGLVELGKDEVLAFARAAAGDCFAEAPVLSRLFFLSLGKGKAVLDAGRTRELLISENEDVLGGVAENTSALLAVMAQAAGRVSQMGACIEAAGRLMDARSEDGAEKIARIEVLRDVLSQAEKAAVKIRRESGGVFSLMPLDEARAGSVAAGGIGA